MKDNKIQFDIENYDDDNKQPTPSIVIAPSEDIEPLFQEKLYLQNNDNLITNSYDVESYNADGSLFISKSFTLKDVLNNYKPTVDNYTAAVEKGEDSKKEAVKEINFEVDNAVITNENETYEDEPVDNHLKVEEENSESFIENLLQNNQISKVQIDISIKESYKVDNNLKLYFLMNVLNQNSTDDEKLISTFKLKLFILNEPELCLISCLCAVSNKNIFIYKIKDKLL